MKDEGRREEERQRDQKSGPKRRTIKYVRIGPGIADTSCFTPASPASAQPSLSGPAAAQKSFRPRGWELGKARCWQSNRSRLSWALASLPAAWHSCRSDRRLSMPCCCRTRRCGHCRAALWWHRLLSVRSSIHGSYATSRHIYIKRTVICATKHVVVDIILVRPLLGLRRGWQADCGHVAAILRLVIER